MFSWFYDLLSLLSSVFSFFSSELEDMAFSDGTSLNIILFCYGVFGPSKMPWFGTWLPGTRPSNYLAGYVCTYWNPSCICCYSTGLIMFWVFSDIGVVNGSDMTELFTADWSYAWGIWFSNYVLGTPIGSSCLTGTGSCWIRIFYSRSYCYFYLSNSC